MALQNSKSGTEMAQSGTEKKARLGKTHQDYWPSKLRKRWYEWEGKTVEIPNWQVRIAHLGRREWFNLGTPNKAAAAATARNIYISLVANGWQSTLAKYKPDMLLSGDVATVGAYLQQVKAQSGLRQVTFEIYARKFRTLVAGLFNIDGGSEKFDYVNGGRAKWLERINRVRLDKLTSDRIENWKTACLKEAEKKNPLAYKQTKTTLNSIIRGSKALFTADITKKISAKLPSPLPLRDVENVSVERSRYKSTFNVNALLTAANHELARSAGEDAEENRECFKIFLLAIGAGLRRDEIDTLSWLQIDWTRNVIRVETTIHTAAKSHDSENEVDVDPGLLKILKGYMAESQSQFVISSPIQPRPNVRYHHYRCDRLFNRLIKWLRAKGVASRSPIHCLRKEFGSQIAKQGGIFAASLALRHSDIQLTRDYYLDKKTVVVFPIGKLLKPRPISQRL